MKKQSALILLAVLTLALSADTGNAAEKRSAAVSRQTRTPELGSIDRFREAFQNDEGKVRLVALISPT